MMTDLDRALAFLRQGDSPAEAAETAGVPVGVLLAAERKRRKTSRRTLPEASGSIRRLSSDRSYGAVDWSTRVDA